MRGWRKEKRDALIGKVRDTAEFTRILNQRGQWAQIYKNSSPDAMRELAGLNPLEIKGAMTYSELDGKEVSHIYENSELLNT